MISDAVRRIHGWLNKEEQKPVTPDPVPPPQEPKPEPPTQEPEPPTPPVPPAPPEPGPITPQKEIEEGPLLRGSELFMKKVDKNNETGEVTYQSRIKIGPNRKIEDPFFSKRTKES